MESLGAVSSLRSSHGGIEIRKKRLEERFGNGKGRPACCG